MTASIPDAKRLALLRRARIATIAFFAINGVVGFSILPRLAEIQQRAGLDDAGLGVALAVGTAGGLVVGPIAGVLVHRWGAVVTTGVMGLLGLPGLIIIGFATSGIALAVGFFVLLAADAVMDAGMNTRALQIQAAYRRTIVNSFHGWWSLATIIGSGLGAGSAVVGISLPVLTIAIVVLAAIATVIAWRLDSVDIPIESSPDQHRLRHRRTATMTMLRGGGLALIAFIMLAVTVEDVPVRWGSVYLEELTASATVIAIAYLVMTSTMTIGRFLGDRIVDRYGQSVVVRASMVLVAVAMALALVQGSAAAFIIASGVSGLGVATLFPAAIQAASQLPGVSAAMGIAVISWFSRLGFVLSPLVVGLVAQGVGLRAGLAATVAAAAGLVLIAGVVGGSAHARRRHQ
jgi:MFS family permease